jgi:serine/threonine protein kinase/WD40 repeat protein
MSDSDSEHVGLLDRLAEEFAERFRRGERPALAEYTDRYPELADDIRELFPAMVKVELADEGQASRESEVKTAVPTKSVHQIGDYRIVREIGRGGMGVVYEAEQVSLGRRVALKVLPRHAAADRLTLERFRREARAAARLHHTNIVPVFEVGQDGDIRFYAMQFIQGQSLDGVITELRHLRIQSQSKINGDAKDKCSPDARAPTLAIAHSILKGGFLPEGDGRATSGIVKEPMAEEPASAAVAQGSSVATENETTEAGPWSDSALASSSSPSAISSAVLPGGKQLSVAETSHRVFHRSVAHIGRQAAGALVHAHARGVIHRDIKPSNLLLDTDGVVWVTDFGLAKAEDDGLTQTGDVLGTIRFMAPERFVGQADPRSDIYALGLTLYELLLLRPAFDSPNRLALIEQVRKVDPPHLRSVDPRIPLDLETIVLKAVEKDPKARYQSAEAMAEDLGRFLADEPIRARQVGAAEQYWRWARRNPSIAILGGVLTAVLVLVTIASLLAAGGYARLAERDRGSAIAERFARLEADQNRKTAEKARIAAQNAEQEMQRIAAQADADKEIAQRENYRSTIKLAESMLQGDAQARYRVADILWGAQPELRGWEWGYLMAHCPLEEWSLQTNQGGLDTLTGSADGRFLATAGHDGTVALWDSWTRNELWRRKTGRARTLEIDPRGRYVGVGSAVASQPSFRILNIPTGKIVHEAARTGTADIAFSSSGKDFYVLAEQNLERNSTDTWSPLASVLVPIPVRHESLKLFVDLAGAYVGVNDVFNGPPEERLRDNPRTALFDAQTLRPVADLDTILPTYASNLFSGAKPILHSGLGEIVYSDGPRVIKNSLVRNTNAAGNDFHEIAHPVYVEHLVYDPRSETAIAASNDGTITLDDGGGERQTMSHGSPLCGLTFFADGRFVTGGADGLLKCWKPRLAANLSTSANVSPESASSDFVAFAKDGDQLLYQNFNRRLNWLFNMTGLTHRVVHGPLHYGDGFPLIRPGTNELIADNKTGLVFYSLARDGTAGIVETRSIAFARPYRAAFDGSGRILVASNRDGQVAVFDVSSQERLPVPEAQGIGLVAVNPAGTRVALLTGASLQVWDVATGRLHNRLDGPHGKLRVQQEEDWTDKLASLVFHPDGELVAFVKPSENSSYALVLWDSALGKIRASIHTETGRRIFTIAFSPDGNRIFTHDGTIWDWRIGKVLFAFSGAKATNAVAPSPDGVSLAIAGWNPSLRVAKALPWNNVTRRDGDFYRAADDLWSYTAQLPAWIKQQTGSTDDRQPVFADEAEILGDIKRHRGQAALALAHYTNAIEIRRRVVLGNPKKAHSQYRLATVYEKRLAVADAGDPAKGAAVLEQAVEFWQKLISSGRPDPVAWRYLLDFRLRLADSQLTRSATDAKALLLAQIQCWGEECTRSDDRLLRYGLREFWARLAVAVPGLLGDQKAIDDLVERHPELLVPIGDQYAADKNWERAIAIYSKAITALSGFDHVRKLVGLAGTEKDKDEPHLGDAAKAKLRRQALIWLKAELTSSAKLIDFGSPQARQGISQTLEYWKQDSKLAEFRDTATLAKLPADEHMAWKSLWADIDSLSERAAAGVAFETKLEPDKPETLAGVHMRAHALEVSKPSEAEPLFRRALEGYRKTQGPDSELALDLTRDVANLLDRTGRSAEAEPLYRDALERARKQFGPDDPRTVLGFVAPFGMSLVQQGKWSAAESLLRDALEQARKQFGPDDPRAAAIMAPYSLSLVEQGKWSAAEPVLRECLAIREKMQPDDWTTFNARSLLGGSLMGQKKYAEAEPLIIAGYEGMKAREAKIPRQGKSRMSDAELRVVKLYEDWGKKDKAALWRAKLATPSDHSQQQP